MRPQPKQKRRMTHGRQNHSASSTKPSPARSQTAVPNNAHTQTAPPSKQSISKASAPSSTRAIPLQATKPPRTTSEEKHSTAQSEPQAINASSELETSEPQHLFGSPRKIWVAN